MAIFGRRIASGFWLLIGGGDAMLNGGGLDANTHPRATSDYNQGLSMLLDKWRTRSLRKAAEAWQSPPAPYSITGEIMSMQYLVWSGIVILLIISGLIFSRRRMSGQRQDDDRVALVHSSHLAAKPARPHSIILGDDAQRPAIRIAPLSNSEHFRTAKALPVGSALEGRLNVCLQAVPSLLLEEGHRGKQLMEVVINGELVQVKDGLGWRAWSVGADNKISEHAKLFDINDLQTMVNAAAVWQVASVLVAQKHLADISAKLEDIRKSVHGLAHFIDEERRAQVTGSHRYLESVVSAIRQGELSPAVRNELESCDRELLQVQDHLQQEFERRCAQPVGHMELAGTGGLEKETVAKYEKLKALASDLRLTLRTRAFVWYVLSLYPDEPGLKQAKMEGLLRSAEEIERSLHTIESSAIRDCQQFTSIWNKEETLAIRKTNVREAAEALADELRDISAQARDEATASHTALLANGQSLHLMFEVEHGRVGAFRINAAQA